MADEENRRMDLNLYLGLPRRRTESSDLGSDLALGSVPLSEEMSSSNTQNTQSTQNTESVLHVLQAQVDSSVVNGNGSGLNQDVEYAPYAVSFVPASPTSLARRERQALDFRGIGLHVSEVAQRARMYPQVMEGSSSNHGEHVPICGPAYANAPNSGSRPVSAGLEVQEESNRVPNLHAPPRSTQVRVVNVGPGAVPEAPDVRQFLPEFRFRSFAAAANAANAVSTPPHLRMRRVRSRVPASVNPDWARSSAAAATAVPVPVPLVRVPDVSAPANAVPEKPKEVAAENAEQNDETDVAALAANFECNVCLEMAKEPVVTSCGHLFCWPCLFQWLHVHSDHRECPVCKGEVTDADITPIYGRGNSEKEPESAGKEVESGVKIPPRPQGRRAESERQRIRRPFSRRPREEIGSWSFIFDDVNNRGEELGEAPSLRSLEGPHRRMLSRLMAAQRFHWEEGFDNMLNFAGNGSSSNAGNGNGNDVVHVESHYGPLDPSAAPVLVRRGLDFWRRVTDRFIPLPADPNGPPILGGDIGGNGTGNANPNPNPNNSGASGASASTSANPRTSRAQRRLEAMEATAAAIAAAATAEQASASSTAAVIQGEARGEPSSVGSARTLRRSRRYTPSGSLDIDAVDQALAQASNRRRLN